MRRDDRRLYRACQADLRSLIGSGAAEGLSFRSADDICALLARQRGMAIHRYPASLGGHPYGLVVRGKDFCLILYERRTSSWHQQGIILHECAHILYDHRGAEDGTAAALRVLVPDLPIERFSTIHRRTGDEEGHRPDDEDQAEAFATVGLAWLSHASRRGHSTDSVTAEAPPPGDPAVATAVRRLLEDFAGG